MESDYMAKCPKCGNEGPRFRDRPKGEIAEFVCIECLPPTAPPIDGAVRRLAKMITGKPDDPT